MAIDISNPSLVFVSVFFLGGGGGGVLRVENLFKAIVCVAVAFSDLHNCSVY